MTETSNIDKGIFEFCQFRKFGWFTPGLQIVVVTILYVTTTLCYHVQVQQTAKMDGYPPSVTPLFVPIYEEVLFRGIMLHYFEKHYGFLRSIICVSILFGLWHLKNILWLEPTDIARQIAYTALFFSPIMCWMTLKTRSLWPAVILHYLNNLSVLIFIRHLH